MTSAGRLVSRTLSFLAAAIALLAFSSCARGPAPSDQLSLEPASFAELPGWRADKLAAALPALVRSCAALAKLPDTASAGPEGSAIYAADWRATCAAAHDVPAGNDGAARAYFERWFQPFLAKGNAGPDGLFTGYYEPELAGARQPDARYHVPLYGKPRDLVTAELGLFDDGLAGKHVVGHVADGRLLPYATRAEIEAGAASFDAPTLFWVTDPIELFFLQIQGSGRLKLPDGSLVHVGYAAENGRRYSAIGKILVQEGELRLEEVSLQSLKAWLRAHPRRAKTIMDRDNSYVFFREVTGEAPVGAEGVALTPGRSLAIDPHFLAYGLPVWLDIESPEGHGRLERLVVAQDRGGAIRGPVRGDLFWGAGAEAERHAGTMRAHGRYYLLLPRKAVPIS
jgi:membrane-bound lytic murein transglycosylase A